MQKWDLHVASLSLRRPGFGFGSVHVGIMLYRVALGEEVFLRVLPILFSFHWTNARFSHFNDLPTMLYSYGLSNRQRR